jgi:hypothetical protein
MNTTKLQHDPCSVPKYRNIQLYLAGLLLGLIIFLLMGRLFIVHMYGFGLYRFLGWPEFIISYDILLITSVVLSCIHRTRPFGLGFLTAAIVFLSVAINLVIWFLSSWSFNVHF